MKIEYMDEFLMLSKTRNYSQAAENLFISVSSLSRHIMALEMELGYQLFVRGTRSISLTRAGHLLVPFAEEITQSMSRCSSLLLEECGKNSLTLNIFFTKCIIQYGIMHDLISFRDLNSDISATIAESSPLLLYQKIKTGECDFGICYEYDFLESSEIDSLVLATDKLAVALPTQHPLAKNKCIDIRQLCNEHFIFHNRDGASCHHTLNVFKSAGIKPKVLTYVESGEYILKLVSQGIGISIVEKGRFSGAADGVSIVELTPTVEKKLVIIYKKHSFNNAEKRFIDYICSKSYNSRLNTEMPAAQ